MIGKGVPQGRAEYLSCCGDAINLLRIGGFISHRTADEARLRLREAMQEAEREYDDKERV